MLFKQFLRVLILMLNTAAQAAFVENFLLLKVLNSKI